MAAYRYWRLVVTRWYDAGVSTSTAGHVRVGELQFVTAGGAVWPQTALTAANAPAPYAVTASANEAGFPPYRAFDGVASDSNRWLSGTGITSAWLQIDMGQSLEFAGIRYAPDAAATLNGGYFSVDFAIWASNTGAFAGEHVVLSQHLGVTSGWANNTFREFVFAGGFSYPVSETFATSIPLGFASSNTGNLTATYNSGAQAVDLSAGTASITSYWVLSVPYSTDFYAEFDLELVSDPTNRMHFGIGLSTGAGFEGYRFAALDGVGLRRTLVNSGGGVTVDEVVNLTPLGPRLGNRAIWRIDYTRSGGVGRTVVSVDGAILTQGLDTVFGAVQPGVFVYGSTVRVHSVTANTGTGYPYVTPGARTLPTRLAISSGGGQGAPTARGFGMGLLRRNHWQGGNGRIRGTVAEKGSPNAPVHRKVRLFHEASGVLVSEVWSDATTGAYSFDNIDMSPQKYTVLSYDHTGAFRAVVADGQIPEVMA